MQNFQREFGFGMWPLFILQAFDRIGQKPFPFRSNKTKK